MNHDPDADEAQHRLNRAIYELRLQRGNGAWNLNTIEHILTGQDRG